MTGQGLIISRETGLLEFRNIRGAAGRMLWRQLANRTMTCGLQQFNYCALQEGIAVEHPHIVAEEVFMILSGHARVTIGDEARDATGGDLILTSRGGRHSVGQAGDEPVELLIIEVIPQEKGNAAQPPAKGMDGGSRGRYHVENLASAAKTTRDVHGGTGAARVGAVDPDMLRATFDAPWRSISLTELEPGSTLGPLDGHGVETVIYVTEGTGRAIVSGGDVELSRGQSIAACAGESLELRNTHSTQPLRLFMAEIETSIPDAVS